MADLITTSHLEESRARHEQARLRLETLQLEAQAKILEGYYGSFTGGGFGDFVDPRDSFRDPDLAYLTSPHAGRRDRRQGLPGSPDIILSEFELDEMRGGARVLLQVNGTAQGAVGNLKNYIIKTGFEYTAQPEEGAFPEVAKVVAAQANQVLREFEDLNQWKVRQRETLERRVRDGDAILRHFRQRDGTVKTRWVEPEQVRHPPGGGEEWSWGILTDPDDCESVEAYAVAYSHVEDWEEVPAGDIAHMKGNVDAKIKRGISDFFSTQEALEQHRKLCRALRLGATMQASIAWVEQYGGASRESVQAHIADARDVHQPTQPHPLTGKQVNAQHFEPGTILKIGKGREYIQGPLGNQHSPQHIEIAQFDLRNLASRWNMPEYVLTSDASNNNFASIKESGTPFNNAIECHQDAFTDYFLTSIWIALEHAAHSGRFHYQGRVLRFREVLQLIDVHVTAPDISKADPDQEARVDHMDIDKGVMSIQTRRAKIGLDDEQERRNLEEEPVKQPGQDMGGDQQGFDLDQPEPTFESRCRGCPPGGHSDARLIESLAAGGDVEAVLIVEAASLLQLAGEAASILEFGLEQE